MPSLSSVEFRDRAAFLDDTLIVSDLHLGKDAASNVEWPVGEADDVVERFEGMVEYFDPGEIVIAGDLLHSFQTVPRMATDTVAGLETVANRVGANVVVTTGNHDTLLDAIWSGEPVTEYRIGDSIVLHGHVEPEGRADRYVIGHDHPTIEIEGRRHACYLVGEGVYDGSDLIVLPAFNRLLRGVSVNAMSAADFMSPLVRTTDELRPIVYDDSTEETLRFPPLGSFRDRL